MSPSYLKDAGCVWLSLGGCWLYVGFLAVFGSRLEDAGCVWFLSGGCWLCLILAWKMLAVCWLLYEGCVFGSRLENAGCVWFLWRMLGVSWLSSGGCCVLIERVYRKL